MAVPQTERSKLNIEYCQDIGYLGVMLKSVDLDINNDSKTFTKDTIAVWL